MRTENLLPYLRSQRPELAGPKYLCFDSGFLVLWWRVTKPPESFPKKSVKFFSVTFCWAATYFSGPRHFLICSDIFWWVATFFVRCAAEALLSSGISVLWRVSRNTRTCGRGWSFIFYENDNDSLPDSLMMIDYKTQCWGRRKMKDGIWHTPRRRHVLEHTDAAL